jgi:hypothetical protein
MNAPIRSHKHTHATNTPPKWQAHRVHRQQRGLALIVHAERDFYQLLGVGRDADKKQIKSAYRQLARKFHPVGARCRGWAFSSGYLVDVRAKRVVQDVPVPIFMPQA